MRPFEAAGGITRDIFAGFATSALKRGAANLSPRSVTAGVVRQDGRNTLHLTCVVSADDDEPSRFAFSDVTSCPLPLIRSHCSVAAAMSDGRSRGGTYDGWKLRDGATWSGAEFEFEFALSDSPDGGDGFAFLALPSMAPRFLAGVPERGADLPRVRLLETAHLRGSGVPAAGPAIGSPGFDYLSTALSAAEPLRDGPPSPGMLVTPGLHGYFREHGLERPASLVQAITEFYARLFGSIPGLSVLLVQESEARVRATQMVPGCIIANKEDYGLVPAGAEPVDARLARQVASCWFGGGIRFTGRHAAEMEYALNTAAGMMWPLAVGRDANVRSRMGDYYAAVRRPQFDWLHRMRGHPRPGLTFRLVIALYEALIKDSRAADMLRGVVAENWGRYVGTNELSAIIGPGRV